MDFPYLDVCSDYWSDGIFIYGSILFKLKSAFSKTSNVEFCISNLKGTGGSKWVLYLIILFILKYSKQLLL